jgi:glutamate synthase domain-containing protein 3
MMAEMGFTTMDEMVGRVELLDQRKAVEHWKARGLDFSRLFHRPAVGGDVAIHQDASQDHGLDKALDHELMAKARPALDTKKPVQFESRIFNRNRTVGAMLSGEVARRYGHAGLADDSIHVKFKGTAGQTFGGWLAHGVTFELEGDGNDYVGKGLSGGRLVVYPPKECPIIPEENIIVGNTVMYGAITGEAYFRGVAGERFCVRNSGASAVVEGTGDHGCEYMTGGTVVVLGPVGANFGAGMTGGRAYLYDPTGRHTAALDDGSVTAVRLSAVIADRDDGPVRFAEFTALLEAHRDAGSALAGRLLDDTDDLSAAVWLVEPNAIPVAAASAAEALPVIADASDLPLPIAVLRPDAVSVEDGLRGSQPQSPIMG